MAVCVINFTFLYSYYIQQLLNMDHDCPVPVNKHNSFKDPTPTPDPSGGIKGLFSIVLQWQPAFNILSKNAGRQIHVKGTRGF